MIIHTTLSYAADVTIPPSRRKDYREVVFHEAIDVPDLRSSDAPLAIEYDERGKQTTLRSYDGRFFERLPPSSKSFREGVSDGTLLGRRASTLDVPEDKPGLRGTSPDLRAAAVREASLRFVTVDGEAWARVFHQPKLHFKVEYGMALGAVSGPMHADICFSMRDLDFVPTAMAAMFPDRALELRMPEFRLYDANAFGDDVEPASLATAGNVVLTEMRKGLEYRSERQLVAYARLRDACDNTKGMPALAWGESVLREMGSATSLFDVGEKVSRTVESHTARWDAYAARLQSRADAAAAALDEEIEAIAGMAP